MCSWPSRTWARAALQPGFQAVPQVSQNWRTGGAKNSRWISGLSNVEEGQRVRSRDTVPVLGSEGAAANRHVPCSLPGSSRSIPTISLFPKLINSLSLVFVRSFFRVSGSWRGHLNRKSAVSQGDHLHNALERKLYPRARLWERF